MHADKREPGCHSAVFVCCFRFSSMGRIFDITICWTFVVGTAWRTAANSCYATRNTNRLLRIRCTENCERSRAVNYDQTSPFWSQNELLYCDEKDYFISPYPSSRVRICRRFAVSLFYAILFDCFPKIRYRFRPSITTTIVGCKRNLLTAIAVSLPQRSLAGRVSLALLRPLEEFIHTRAVRCPSLVEMKRAHTGRLTVLCVLSRENRPF